MIILKRVGSNFFKRSIFKSVWYVATVLRFSPALSHTNGRAHTFAFPDAYRFDCSTSTVQSLPKMRLAAFSA